MKIKDGKNYDVLVIGAGSAGFCAAVQAARAGCRTALVETYTMPGGTLTVFGNTSIDAFFNPHRPKGDRRVIGGIAWEYVQRLEQSGYASVPDPDMDFERTVQYGVRVDPIGAAACMDDLLLDAGVELYYGQPLADVDTEPSADGVRVTGAVISTKAGLVRLGAKILIDCSGDGDLCAWAGAPFETAESLQPGTMRLYIDTKGASFGDLAQADAAWKSLLQNGTVQPENLFADTFCVLLAQDGNNTNHVSALNAADNESRTRAEIRERRTLTRLIDTLHEAGDPIRIVGCAPQSGARESRRILGDRIMTGSEYIRQTQYADAVCYTYWYIDIHQDNGLPTKHVYLHSEQTPTISLVALRPQGLENVYMAGRCVSADRECASAIRVKASCMAMGQAAGAAAAIGIKNGTARTRDVSAQAVQEFLKANGAIVPNV